MRNKSVTLPLQVEKLHRNTAAGSLNFSDLNNLVDWGRVGRGSVTRVGNIGDVTVTIILVSDGLDATIGESDVVRSSNSLSAAVLFLAHVDVRVVVLNVPGEVVGATDLNNQEK